MDDGNLNDKRIGWVGAGRMGAALATRLLDAGCDVAVYNRTRAKCEPLAELGATIVDQPADLSDRDIVFTILAGSADFQQVVAGPEGLLSGSGPAPAVVVDSTTISAEASAAVRAEAEKRGTALLAAPVSGNPKVVKAGRLTMVTSGPERGARRRAALPRDHGRRRRHLLWRRGPRAAGQGVPQPDARDRRPDARGDPRAGREGRRLAGRPDGVHEQQRARLDLHPLQDPGVRQPRLHADVHPRAAAQGLRAGARSRPRARRADAGGVRARSRSSRR